MLKSVLASLRLSPSSASQAEITLRQIEKAREIIKQSQNLVVLTGAGISAASGLPTFRGKDGIYGKGYKGEDHPARILTMKYFRANPELFWKWHYLAYHKIKEGKPNQGHHSILQLQEQFKNDGRQFSLVTQNIDNYHTQLVKESDVLNQEVPNNNNQGTYGYGHTNGVLEIHGNWQFMRCSNEEGDCTSENHFHDIPQLPSIEKLESGDFTVPNCSHCNSMMKPHTMLFDEYYQEKFYRIDSVSQALREADTLLLVGTAFYTSLAKSIVQSSMYKRLRIIEINKELQLSKFKYFLDICQIQGLSEEILPQIVQGQTNFDKA